MSKPDIDQYLKRIHYSGSTRPSLSTLQKLVHHHLFHVPFENIDVYYGEPVVLYTESIYRKIVGHRRGGYCYELNGLFYYLLSSLDFDVSMISGRVNGLKGYGREFDHMALLVNLDGRRWLVDVGFGDFALKPLLLQPGEKQNDGRCDYLIQDSITIDGNEYFGVGKQPLGKPFMVEYAFTTTPYRFEDFEGMNNHQQLSPTSYFVQNLMCSLPTVTGRISIVNNRVIETIHGVKRAKQIHDHAHLLSLLRRHFNMHCTIPSDYALK